MQGLQGDGEIMPIFELLTPFFKPKKFYPTLARCCFGVTFIGCSDINIALNMEEGKKLLAWLWSTSKDCKCMCTTVDHPIASRETIPAKTKSR
jgi:hypothetical protein